MLMMLFDGVVYALTGAAAGFFAGLLGIGGGVIISPLLIFFLPSKMAAEVSTHAAIATALAVTTITTAASFITHARGGAVHWRSGILLAVGAASAAVIVGIFAWRIPAAALQSLLAMFLLFVGISMLRAKKPQQQPPPQTPPDIPPPLLITTGGIIGALSAVLGIAGGIMTVPFLARRRFVMHRAIGTSAFVGFPLTAAASAGYVGGGWHHPALPPDSWGFVYPPAFVGIVLFSVIFAAIGARTTAKLPEALLRKLFGALLLVAAARLLALLA